MSPSSFVKIVAAFVAGVVVALGSALVYIRVSDPSRDQPPTQTVQQALPAPAAPATAAPVPAAPAPTAAPQEVTPAPPSPVQVKEQKIQKKATEKPKPVEAAERPPDNTPAPEPAPAAAAPREVQIAQNTPRPSVTPPPAYPLPEQPTSEASPQQGPLQPGAAQVQSIEPSQPVTRPAARQPHVVTLPAGTNVFVRLGETLSTEHNYTGDTFRGTLDVPIVTEGFIIADKGSKVLGQVVKADKAGRVAGESELTLMLTEIHTTDGQTVHIATGNFDQKGPSNAKKSAAKIGGGAALGAIIGAIAGGGKGAAIGAGAGGAAGTGVALAGHGKATAIPTETKLTFALSAPVTITERLSN